MSIQTKSSRTESSRTESSQTESSQTESSRTESIQTESIHIEPIEASFGAVVTGLDLSALDAPTWTEIETAFHEFALLVFPGQHLSAAEQIAFAERFGDIELLNTDRKIVPISNRRADGDLLGEADHGMQILKGNEGWHIDSTYMHLAAKGAVMSAHVVPPSGGQTEWADMRAAYDALDDSMKDYVDNLSAYHSLFYSQRRIGHVVATGAGYGFDDPNHPPLRPLVKVHPVTGRKSLYIGRHAYGIPGLDPAESERLLDDLVTTACQTPRTYAHEWQVGDVVVWDNRCLLHRARPYEYSEPRVMWHTRIAGDPTSELGVA